MPVQIKFYLTTGDYGFLTNFHKRIFIAEDIKWKTSEHYYQWRKMKFLQSIGEPITEEFLQRIIDAKSPMIAKKLGHKKCNVDKWDAIKVEEMKHVVREKFKHPVLRERLLATEDAIRIEHTSRDAFWGDGGNDRGLNMLGKCLMQIRDEIRDKINLE